MSCQQNTQAEIWSNQLTILFDTLTITGTDPYLLNTIYSGIESTFHPELSPDGKIELPPPPTTHPQYNTFRGALAKQTTITWDECLRGRFSSLWAQIHDTWNETAPPNPDPDYKPITGTVFLQKIISWIWQTFFALWKSRNKQIHDESTDPNQPLARLRLRTKILDLYQQSTQLAAEDQIALFSTPAAVMLLQGISLLKMWIAEVEMVMVQHRKEITRGLIAQQNSHETTQSPSVAELD